MGTEVEVLKLPESGTESLSFIAKDGSVWVVFYPEWWDIASLLWWWLTPKDKKAWIQVKRNGEGTIRARAVRVSRTHVRIGNVDKVK